VNQQKGLKRQIQLNELQGAMPAIIRRIWQPAFRNSRNPCNENRETEGFRGVLGED